MSFFCLLDQYGALFTMLLILAFTALFLSQEQILDPTSYGVTPSDWYSWANEPNFSEQFHQTIVESKQELNDVAKVIEKPVGFCIWYYYHKYKPSANYPQLKQLMDDLNARENSDECAICEEGGDLLCCETCPQSVSGSSNGQPFPP